MKNRVPPQDIEAEQSVIGGCLLSSEALSVAIEGLDAAVFYSPAHRTIWKAILSLFSTDIPVDMVTLMGRLRDDGMLDQVGGAAYLARLTDVIPSVVSMPGYCTRLREKHALRKLISHCSDVMERCYSGGDVDDITDFAESGMFDLVAEHSRGVRRIDELVTESMELLEKRCSSDGGITGLPTHFIDLDKKLAGMQATDLLLLAARPSMGKTAFAMNVARNVALQEKKPVLVFSLEMSGQQLTERMISGCSEVDSQSMRTGSLVDADWPKITRAAGMLSDSSIYIDDESNLSIVDIRARARRVKARFDIGLILIDYLQLIHGVGKADRVTAVGEISRGLKSLAKELNVPVLALSQLNRSLEGRTDKRPMLSDLRESGALEQDADVIMFLYRDEYYHPNKGNKDEAELIIGKQRNGPIGTVNLIFQKEISTFRSAAHAF